MAACLLAKAGSVQDRDHTSVISVIKHSLVKAVSVLTTGSTVRVKPYHCDICSKIFYHRAQLTYHKWILAGGKP
ncbi:---NA--- [Octopus vulgaris]|uniref:---NA n=1 Tax=Octopus vulgaris TaxID=6645 RepID=A0AA36EY71_OCTVU|nr:---NA--- [Octopus vulgaris]